MSICSKVVNGSDMQLDCAVGSTGLRSPFMLSGGGRSLAPLFLNIAECIYQIHSLQTVRRYDSQLIGKTDFNTNPHCYCK